jgi:pSer/pThr/pTyr-binding forkhead associated (FHA) protein
MSPPVLRKEGSEPLTYRFVPEKLSYRIGRGKGNDLELHDKKVSQRHAEIVVSNGIFYINDLGSRNGTYVNDNKITPDCPPLKDKDRIRLGFTNLTFLLNG